jgi:PPOX class probable F420-dependent enzyme
VRPDGRPHVVVCCFALQGEVAYSAVDGKPKTSTDLQRLRNIAGDDGASLLVDHYDDDWTRLWWVRADGRARTVPDGPERERALALLVAKYAQYREQPPAGPVLALDVDRWRSWRAGG